MIIDTSTFLLAVSALAAGGVGGYFAGESGALSSSIGATEQQAPSRTLASTPPRLSAAPVVPAAPPCDDSIGTPAACPSPGYSADEGGCDSLPTRRCEDFKKTMKPRVAELAVACVNALGPAQRCDASRLNLCGHVALMNACSATETSGGIAPSDDDLDARCETIQQACGATSGATLRECRETLTGLDAQGRDQMVACMKTHCVDKGLAGCEALSSASAK
jgi:hypothetical protein